MPAASAGLGLSSFAIDRSPESGLARLDHQQTLLSRTRNSASVSKIKLVHMYDWCHPASGYACPRLSSLALCAQAPSLHNVVGWSRKRNLLGGLISSLHKQSKENQSPVRVQDARAGKHKMHRSRAQLHGSAGQKGGMRVPTVSKR